MMLPMPYKTPSRAATLGDLAYRPARGEVRLRDYSFRGAPGDWNLGEREAARMIFLAAKNKLGDPGGICDRLIAKLDQLERKEA